MNGARVLSLVLGSVVLLASTSSACTNIYGIPGECCMRVLVCDVPGDAAPALIPAEVSSVVMDGNWAYSACHPSPDGAVNVVSVSAERMEVHYRGRRRSIPRGPYNAGHAAEWDSSQRRFAFWAPAEPGVGRRVAVCDVRSMAASPAYRVVYTAPKDSAPFGVVWVPDRDELLVVERRLVGERSFGAVVKVEVATGAPRDLVVEEGTIDFVVTQSHRASAGSAPVALIGSPEGLKLLDCVTGALKVVGGVPAVGLYNLELGPDGRRAAAFFRRAVPAADGRTFLGVYLLDLEALVAGDAAGATQLYDGTDVHTLWLSPAGDEVLWASPWNVWRARAERGAVAQQLAVAPGDGEELKGVAYDPSGARLAVTVGARLVAHDLATGATTEVARFGEGLREFAAEPRWINDRILVSVFEDMAARRPSTRDPALGPGRQPR